MKYKNYEKRFIYYVLVIIYSISFSLFIIFLFTYKHTTYINFTGVITGQNITLIIPDSEKKYFYQNNYLYCDNKKRKFTIKKINQNIMKRDKEKYHELFITFNYSKNKFKENDPIIISLAKQKERNINLFKYIWKED